MTLADLYLVGIAMMAEAICCFYLGYLASRTKR